MNHTDHVSLLRGGVATPGGVWADLGSGTGAFTLALADLLGSTGAIYSVDKDASALAAQKQTMRLSFPSTAVHYLAADFTKPLSLPPLDGVVMANSLHFHRAKEPIVQLVRSYLKPGGRLILVEYDTDHGNHWVPYPLSFETWRLLAHSCELADTWLLAAVPSRFLGRIYSALSLNQEERSHD
jgi:SAM-dependent methyltransferase